MSTQRFYMDVDSEIVPRLYEVARATRKPVDEVLQQCVTIGLATIVCTIELLEMLEDDGSGFTA